MKDQLEAELDLIVLDLVEPEGKTKAQLKADWDQKYLYQNSELSRSEVAEQAKSVAHGTSDPRVAIMEEKPEHRVILLLKFKGFSNKEIAEETGYTPLWVGEVVRQPWFKLRLSELFSVAEAGAVDDILTMQAGPSLLKLIDLRDNAKSEDIQFRSASEILNRRFGKAPQKVEVTGQMSHVIGTLDQINEQLQAIELEKTALMGTTFHEQPRS